MWIDVPKTVRVVSKKMNIDKTFYPDSAERCEDVFSYEDLKHIAKDSLFDYVTFQPLPNSVYSLTATENFEDKWVLEENRWFNAKECEFVNIDSRKENKSTTHGPRTSGLAEKFVSSVDKP